MENENFKIKLSNNWFNKGDIIYSTNQKLKVLETPHKKWYKILLHYISFCYYKVPHQYKVKVMLKDEYTQ